MPSTAAPQRELAPRTSNILSVKKISPIPLSQFAFVRAFLHREQRTSDYKRKLCHNCIVLFWQRCLIFNYSCFPAPKAFASIPPLHFARFRSLMAEIKRISNEVLTSKIIRNNERAMLLVLARFRSDIYLSPISVS